MIGTLIHHLPLVGVYYDPACNLRGEGTLCPRKREEELKERSLAEGKLMEVSVPGPHTEKGVLFKSKDN